jgi:hypothetical protein
MKSLISLKSFKKIKKIAKTTLKIFKSSRNKQYGFCLFSINHPPFWGDDSQSPSR